MDEFTQHALLGGLALAAVLGPLGCFVLWRRMAYAGDAMAHASLLGVALSLISGGLLPITPALFAVAALMAWLLSRVTADSRYENDGALGLLAQGALALALVLVALNRTVRVDMNAYLFGDILAIGPAEAWGLAAFAALLAGTLAALWRRLLMTTLDPAVAAVNGISPARMQLVFTLMLAAVIAVAVKLVGALLITALLIMPAATARAFSRTPAQMALGAAMLGMVAVAAGLFASLRLDAPTGPMMVVVAAAMFGASRVVKQRE